MPRRFDPSSADRTLFAALLAAAAQHGGGKEILEDPERAPLTYRGLILASLVLGSKLSEGTRRGEAVGVLLPSVNGMAVTLFGLNAFGRVAGLLNFTAGVRNLRSALGTAEIRTIVSSRRFVEQAKLSDVVSQLSTPEPGSSKRPFVVYLEDVRKSIGALDKAVGVLRSLIAGSVHRMHALRPDQPAVILFTSGTEGAPKGVVLSSRNLVANACQIYAHADGILTPDDIVMNPLPMFHSFGLTAATLMPLLNGLKCVLYPSPLHYKQVPSLVRETRSTVMLATDTFLQGYARAAEPGDLATLRFAVAGAERVKEATRALLDKTGTTVLEGYGATEAAPVIACNLIATNRPGTVGRLLPGIEYKLEPVAGLAEGGRLSVKGPNVMLGYMLADTPGVLVPPRDGWHDTGDIVTVDADRFVTIKGRAKRFAKLGGEMISLAAVEAMAAELWPEANHVVVSLPDPRKGEQLVLVTDMTGAERDALMKHARAKGFPELWVPREITIVAAIPVTGSGGGALPATLELAQQRRPGQ